MRHRFRPEKAAAAVATLIALAFAFAPRDASAQTATPSSPAAAPAAQARDESLPPSEDQAKAALDKSPRHGELVNVSLASGKTMRTWIAYPERKDKAGVVIVIHEIFGLSDWIRGVADQLAREGFIAIAPDLITGFGPGGGGTDSVASRDDVVKLVLAVTPAETNARLDAVRKYALALPAANGKTATIGFCWGGGRSFGYAAAQPALNGAVVYYGPPPDAADMARIKAPVVGFYGGDDARVTSTVEPTQAEMKKLGKSYEANVQPGAGHGFLRAQPDRGGKNLEATRKAWPRTIAFLKDELK